MKTTIALVTVAIILLILFLRLAIGIGMFIRRNEEKAEEIFRNRKEVDHDYNS